MKNNIARYGLVVLLVLFAGLALRMARIDREFLGHFGQRQVYEAWLSRNYAHDGINILNSKMDALDYHGKKMNVYRDIPLVNALVAYCNMKLGGGIEFWGRFLSVVFYAGIFIILYFWLRFYFSLSTIITILFVFAFLPLSIIYSQSFIIEPSALFFFIMGTFILERALRSNINWQLLIAALFIGLAFASRSHYLALIATTIYLFYRYRTPGLLKDKWFYATFFIIIAVPVLWQVSMVKLAAAGATKSSFDVTLRLYCASLRDYLNPEIYKKIFDDLTGIVLNPVGFTMLLLGILLWDWRKKNLFFPIFLFSLLLLIGLVPKKFYRHDYYYFPVIVPAAVFIGYAIDKLSDKFSSHHRYIKAILLLVFFAASLRYSINPAFKTPDQQKPYLSQADIVKNITRPEDKIVIIGSDSAFLYYCERQGWVIERMPEELEKSASYIYSEGQIPKDLIELLKHYEDMGTKFIIVYKQQDVIANKILTEHLAKEYRLLKETEFMKIFRRND